VTLSIRILACISSALFASTAAGAQPPASADEILQLALDSQLTREAQWTAGTMDVAIQKTGPSAMSAEFTLTWTDKGVYVDLRQHKSTSLSFDGKLHEEEQRPHRTIFTANEEWGYIPSLGGAFGVGQGRLRRFRGELDVRPHKLWGMFPGTEKVPISRLLRPATDKSAEVSQVEGALTRVDKKTGLVFFFDVAAGGALVRLEHNMHEGLQLKPGIDPGMTTATYEWAHDAHGVPYCRKFRAEYFRPDGTRQPIVTHEVEVISYNSRLSREDAQIDLARLQIPKGTKMRYTAPGKYRLWRHEISRSEAELLQQTDFDVLINETKQSGFAAPKDE
jgi:hypothetical protein